MKIKTVSSYLIESEECRLTAKPYFSGGIEARLALQNFKTHYLVDLALNGKKGIFNGPRFSRIFVDSPEHGVPLLSGAEMLQSDLSYAPLISKKQALSMKEMILSEGTTLISSYGTVGRCIFTRADMVGMVGSDNVLKVIPDSKIPAGYLFSFISSKYGIPQILHGKGGAVVTYLDPSRVYELQVPRLGEVEGQAHELVQKAADLRVEAAEEIKAATNRFLAAAGLEDISSYDWLQNSGRIGFTASISKTILRAVNYIPINQQLSEKVKSDSTDWKPLIELTEPGTLRRGPRFKRIDSEPEYGVELIGQREMSNLVPSGRWVSRNHLPQDKLVFAEEGTIMVNAQGGINETDSFARSQFIYGKKLSYIFSEHFLRVIADEELIPRGALFAYLRSNIAFRLLRSCAVGSMQQDFHPALLAEIPVPIIDDSEAQAVDEMIRSAYQKYDDAIDAEDDARTLVEEAIKEGGR